MSGVLRRLSGWALAVLAGLVLAAPAAAQTTVRADWTNLNKSNFQPINTGDRVVAGPNGVTVTTTIVRDNDGNDAGFVPNYSTGFVSYYTGSVGGQNGVVFYNMNHTVYDPGDYVETVYTFDTPVSALAFSVLNVDRAFTTNANHDDAVAIHYDTGTGFNNLRAANALTATVQLGATVTTGTVGPNNINGYVATGQATDINSTTSNIDVAFTAATTVRAIRIRYYFGQTNPGQNPLGNTQYIGLSDLRWSQANVNTSDLSLTNAISTASPLPGGSVSYTLTLTNSGLLAASNVRVRDLLPDGVSFTGASGYGTYDPATGIWTVPSIALNQTRQIVLTGTVTAPTGITIRNTAEVFTSPNYDTDSTPDNGDATEDDQATASFTVQGTRAAGTAPALNCTARTLFDWDVRAWTSGSLNNSYAVTGFGTVNFAIAGAGFFQTEATGVQTPGLSASLTGGDAAPGLALVQTVDFTTPFETYTTTITLPVASPGAQFRIFDVDYAAADFADKITVSGRYNGATVSPVLTNSGANYIVGNTAIGDSTAADNTGNGNVTVTFNSPVDQIIITYGNANTAPSNPDGQAIALADITLCNPTATVTAAKSSVIISDPQRGTANPLAVPGALAEYCVLVTNAGSATITGVSVSDTLPANVTFVPGSIKSGATCAAATVAEDDNATGADETDPYGATFAAGKVTATATSLAAAGTFAFKMRATIK